MTLPNKYQAFEKIDRAVFSAFCEHFSGITWKIEPTTDPFCGIDVMATAITDHTSATYDIEIKSVFLHKMLDNCFFEADKWYSLVGAENDRKIYFVIYPYLNRIAIWNVTGSLLRSSERHCKELPKNTLRSAEKRSKDVYLLPLEKAKVFKVNLEKVRRLYDALYLEAKEESTCRTN